MVAVLEVMTGPSAASASTPPAGPAGPSERGARGHRRARSLGWLSYAAQVAGLVLYVVTIWVQVYVDTRRMGEVACDWFTESHRRWRLRSSLLFLTWTVLGGLAIPLGIGWALLVPAYLWYVYRLARGSACYARGRVIAPSRNAPRAAAFAGPP
ncbi:MAG: hypothetical protein WB783_18910 [Arenicellales bacterium]